MLPYRFSIRQQVSKIKKEDCKRQIPVSYSPLFLYKIA